jgi:hypothetical protein
MAYQTIKKCGAGLPHARGGLLLWAILSLALCLSLSCSEREETAARETESVSFTLQTLEQGAAGEIDIWVFTPEGAFLCATEGRDMQSGTDGSLAFTAILPAGRFLLVVVTDARALMQRAWPEGIPQGEKADSLLQTLDRHAAGTSPQPQVALMEDVSVAPGLSFTLKIVPWTEVISGTEI